MFDLQFCCIIKISSCLLHFSLCCVMKCNNSHTMSLYALQWTRVNWAFAALLWMICVALSSTRSRPGSRFSALISLTTLSLWLCYQRHADSPYFLFLPLRVQLVPSRAAWTQLAFLCITPLCKAPHLPASKHPSSGLFTFREQLSKEESHVYIFLEQVIFRDVVYPNKIYLQPKKGEFYTSTDYCR